jgi:hypothetical protein
MLTLTRDSQMNKAKRTVRDVASYAQEVIQDERLRADMRSALGHGASATDRVRKGIETGGISTQLVSDKKLRKNRRAMLDDLDDAGDRMRRKKRHRVRNALLMLAGGVAAVVALPRIRPWLAERKSRIVSSASTEPDPVT